MGWPLKCFSRIFPSIKLELLPKQRYTQMLFRKLADISSQKPQRQIPRTKPAMRKRSPGGGGYPLLLVPLTTFGLGTWQIQRWQWKLDLIKDLERKMLAAPVPLPADFSEVHTMEYQRVKVRGRFDHARELYIGPRTNHNAPETMGSSKSATIGVHVVTPFKLADRDETILVNRGHVPFKERPALMRQEGQVEGEVELVGVVRLSDKKSYMENDALKDGYWMTRDIDTMADIAQTSPVFLDADINSTVEGGPAGGQTRVNLRNDHFSYILTWYALTVLTLWVWFRNYRAIKPHNSVVEFVKREHRKL